MRLLFLCLTLGISVCFSNNSYSQSTKISLNLKNKTVKQVLSEIEKNSEFIFFYQDDILDVNRRVSVSASNETIEQILNEVLSATDNTYFVSDRSIYITKKNLDTADKEIVQQQKRTITGRIVDKDSEPIIGANIIEKGTTNGTVTDIDGNFSLQVEDNAVLHISYIGYLAQDITTVGKTTFNIVLQEDTQALEELVVVGYGVQKKMNVIGSIATVNASELVRSPVASTANVLAGRLPGLITQQQSGLPGSDGANLNIRGFGTPLIIVDGIESSLNNIDANEIESISILKDAAAAVYGARAGRGVVLVTTNRGREGKPEITLNSTYSLQRPTNMLRQASSGQQAEMLREAHLQSGLPESTARFTQEQVDLFYAGIDPDYPNTNWMDIIADKYAPQQQYNLSIRGGNDRLKYYGFLGYLNQKSMFKNNGGQYNRYNLRSNVDAKIMDNLRLQVDIASSLEERRFPWRGDEGANSVWQDYWGTEPFYPASLPDLTKIPYANGGGTGGAHISSNSELSGYRNTDSHNFKGSLALDYDFNAIKGLRARAFMNYNQTYSFAKTFQYMIETWTYNYATDTYTSMGGNVAPTLTHTDNRSRNITGQLSISYDRTFGDHSVNGLLLYEVIDSYGDWITASRRDYASTTIDYLFAGGLEDQSTNGSASEMGRAGYIGRLGYSYKSKYLFETTFRYDASAKYSKDTRWGFFPSVSLGWRISEEGFIRNHASSLSNLKLRVSASQTGDDSVASFMYLSGYNYGRRYVFGGATQQGLVATSMANPFLTWETMDIYNAGLEFGLWNNKLYGELDVFYRNRKGMPATRNLSLPSTFGSGLPTENLNSQNNRGFEFQLGYADRIDDFRWDVRANISWSRAKWDHYEEPEYIDEDNIRQNKKSGRWTDLTFGYKSDGLFTSQEEIDALSYTYADLAGGNTTLRPGDIKYIDTNKDGVLDWRDRVEIGKGTVPLWMGGVDINIYYKGFDLSVLMQGAFGFNHGVFINPKSEVYYEERWTQENNNSNALISRLGGSPSNSWGSDFTYISADYLRLKTLTLGYTLPKKWLDSANIQNARVYFAGMNLFTISKLNKYGIDAEAPSGTSSNYYPQMTTYSFGLSVSF